MTPPQQPGEGEPDHEPEKPESPASEWQSDDQTAAEGTGQEDPEQSDAGAHASSESPYPEGDQKSGDQKSGDQESGDQSSAPKKKRKTGVLIGVAAALVLVIGGGIALIMTFVAGSSAQAAAEDYVKLSDKEAQQPKSVTAEDYRPLICGKAMPQIEQLQKQKQEFLKIAKPEQLEQIKKVKTSVKNVEETGDTAKATFESTAPGQGPKSSKLDLIKENGDWKICTSQ